jgi:hypothetical protein
LEKKWLEGSTGVKNDPQGRQVFLLAGSPLGKFLANKKYPHFIENSEKPSYPVH